MGDLTGQTLDRYEIVELTGEGGMATVYRARQLRLDRDVAIKVMRPELAADPTFRERFEREAQASAKLRHPNILTVHDYGETGDGQLYLVVEYVRGGTLRDRLRQPLPPQEAVAIVAQVAEALDYAHQREVIHRDVKPNNILLTHDGRPLLADFGLVKPIQSDRRLTASGVMLGTPDYVAPEQAQGLEIDGRADVYALGVMLFEMLTGQHPYVGETPISIIIKHINEPMPRPSELNPAISPALDEIVAQATAKSPDERYQRAGEMARALRTVLVSGTVAETGVERIRPSGGPPQTPTPGAPAVTPPPTPVPAPHPWYRQTWVWVGAGVLLALVVAAAVLILPSAPSRDGPEAAVGAVPTIRPGETRILIADFKAGAGSERYDVSQRIYDKLSSDLNQLGETDVTVYQVDEVVESSRAAVALGEKYGATTVIWGYYDDIGISPNVEAVGTMAESVLSVGLERLNVDADEAMNFKLYIAKDLPEELSFLTAMSLFQAFTVEGRLEKAITYMVMAADNIPQDPQFRGGGEMVYFMQGILAVFQYDLEGALQNMSQAIAINPNEALFYTMRGTVYAAMGEADLAMADVERALTLDPDEIMPLSTKAYLAWALGDPQAALDIYDQIIEMDPDQWIGYLGRGMTYFDKDDLALALEAWERAAEINPDETILLVARGLIHEKLGQVQLAESEYARARTRGAATDTFSQFLQLVTSSIERAGSQSLVPPLFLLVQCTSHQVHGQSEQALERCDRALESDPAYMDAWWKRGQLHAAQGNWESALADYTAAIQADPSWPWVYYLRALALAELGQTDEAQADLARALELDPVDELRQQIENLVLDK